MLIGRGPKQTTDDLVSLLLECHDRIRQFSALALAIADSPESSPLDEVADACLRVRRYFSEALPLHIQDEEQSIEPRLIGHDANVDEALNQMTVQHRAHETPLRELVQLCGHLYSHPQERVTNARALREVVQLLERAFGYHLELEETRIFPAVRSRLSNDVQAVIVQEMRTRRQQVLR